MKDSAFLRGLRDGAPISLGYFAVAISLGIAARGAGLTAFQAALASLLNNASAGEFAAFTLIEAGAGYFEVGLMTLVAWTCGGIFSRLFTTDAQITAEAVRAIRVCSLALVPLGIQYEIVDGFTALGQVRYSLPLSFWRKLVYFVALFILPSLFGARAAFYAETASDIAGPAVSIAVYALAIRRILARRREAA